MVRRSANGPSVGHTIVLVVVGTVQPASQGSTTGNPTSLPRLVATTLGGRLSVEPS